MSTKTAEPVELKLKPAPFEAVFHKLKGQLMSFIRKRVKDREDAEDIFQDSFSSLASVLEREDPIEQAGAWVYRVARNKIADFYRKKRPATFSEIQSGEEDEIFLPDLTLFSENLPDMDYAKSLFWEEFELALEELPEEQKMVFMLNELEGRTFKEISETTGIGINTLLSRKRYAVLFLRERLIDFYDELLNDN
jgi:RNA polymerase sigma factor (sigma-70 family)